MKTVWTTVDGCGYIELELPMDVVKQCAHSGECLYDVEACLQLPEIRKQMDALSDETMIKSLNEVMEGADQMSRHKLECHVLWVACCNVVDS